jgi:HD-GYP domain-containing protein (c-di-GMP phosphodiesterase class II)
MPLVFSFYGSSGWFLYLIFELIALFIAGKTYVIDFWPIFSNSAMYIVLEALFSFTLSFTIMESLHRHIFLPKYYPEGKLSRFNPKSMSLKMLFTIFYISIGLFPALFMLTVYITLTNKYGIPVDKKILIILAFIILFSILIHINFSHFFTSPLFKLKKATEKIREGDMNYKVQIVSNDPFGQLADTFNDMTSSIDQKNKRLIAVQNSVLTGMATMVESRDNSTGGHIRRTSDCVRIFANELDMPQAFLENVVKAAPMHDLGKIAVPDAILQKPGKFTDEEYEKMKSHSEEGARIVENVLSEVDDLEFKKIAINVAHYHHEKWDGSGYPHHLKGDAIPLEARIMALADVFDALVSRRCYKDAKTFDEAFEIIKNDLGKHFDPVIGQIFIDCRSQLEKYYRTML